MKKLLSLFLIVAIIFMVVKIVGVRDERKLERLHVGSSVLSVEVVKTPGALSKGLGDRDRIGSDGMLFLLPVRIVPTFWMKGMRFGLDFVWINNGSVVALTPNVPPQLGVPDYQLNTYSSGVPADTVLEIPEGDIAKRGIHVGDRVY